MKNKIVCILIWKLIVFATVISVAVTGMINNTLNSYKLDIE